MAVRTLPPYPSGWYAVGLASELAPGTVLSRPFLGGDLVVYRTQSGVVRAVAPYCPHLGAHLGHGGRVDGELLSARFTGSPTTMAEPAFEPVTAPGLRPRPDSLSVRCR